ncbi:WD40 repeat domain-containing serine/threonine protein kinase [Planctomyces sp. SH-PL62]|uniref:WD40 repeat domain-containing serine/threonine protein kinase n=1 Tax=Planctomyces sp. SH-PL62 TaxID=1636152 RepID=UPI00078E46CE|nr:protein kinase [Planctomyces sp. SH-PL62]AMV36633.1 Serine/threonine-protein kinase PknB [Planctomyces sp. SH-PL62]
MGVVYKARQLSPGRIVAVKMILAGDHANARERARLRTEAEAAAKFTHPNIVQVIEADYHQGLPFLVMEYVDGGNLARMLRSMPQPIRWSARLIETLARAIHAAHQSDIVHRDLNPSNILMTQDGVPKIGDFGLAKFLMNDEGHSQSGRLLGTPSYMAPEQLADGGKGVGRHTDVYALGAVLYEMLTGSPPFRGLSPMETLCQVAEGEIVPPSRLRHGLPEDLETICLTCLERSPASRYADAKALADDLRRFQNRQPIHARRTPATRRAIQWAAREPVAAGLLALSFVLTLALLFVAGFYSSRISLINNELVQKDHQLDGRDYIHQVVKGLADSGSEIALRKQYDHELRRIHEHIRNDQPELAIEAFDLLRRSRPHQPGFEWRYIDRLVHRSMKVLQGETVHRAPVARIALGREGRTLISGDEEGRILEWDVDGRSSRPYPSISGRMPVRGLATAGDVQGRPAVVASLHVDEDEAVVSLWDPQGPHDSWTFREPIRDVAEIGFARGGSLLAIRCRLGDSPTWRMLLYSQSGTDWLKESALESTDARCAAFSPRGDAMAVGLGDGSVLVRGRSDQEDLVLLPPEPARPTTLIFSEDGNQLAGGWDDGRVVVWDVRSGEPTRLLDRLEGVPSRLGFCLGGRRLLVLEGTRKLALHALQGPPSRQVLLASNSVPTQLIVSPQGDAVVAGYESEGVRIWDLNEPSAPSQPLSALQTPNCLLFSPSGRSVYMSFDQESIFVWSKPTAPHPRIALAGHAKEAWSLAFTPDGAILASGADDRQIKLWDVASGTELAAIEAHSQTVTGLAFSPDGRELASVSLDGSWKTWQLVREGPEPLRARLEPVRILREPGLSQLRCVAYSPEGDLIAASGLEPDILVHNASAPSATRIIPGAHAEMITALTFSRGRPSQLASASCDNWIRVWDPRSGERADAKRGNGVLLAVAYSPFNPSYPALLAASGDRRRISVWDVNTWEVGDPVRGHPASIRSLAFSDDGATLATGCDDGAVRLCDMITRQVVLTLEGHHDRINAVAFSKDDGTLATCSHTGEVFLWKAGPPSP